MARLFENADPYLIGLSGAIGLFFLQGALHAGPITASRTANVVVNPLVSIVIGATAFGERLRAGAFSVTVDVLAIAVLCAGIALLARSPLVAGVGGQVSDEYLGARAVAARAPVAATAPVPVSPEPAAPDDPDPAAMPS